MGEWTFMCRAGAARLAGGHWQVLLNQMSRSRSIIIYAEEKKSGAGQCGAQTPKQQPTKCRSETGADAPALCHFQRAKERLETAENPATSNGRKNFR
jgi:uncharacterized low-complexity protein